MNTGSRLAEWSPKVAQPLAIRSFMGRHTEPWDTQPDMTLCITGAISALVLPTRLHDRALGQLGKTMLAALLLFAPIANAADKLVPDSWDQVAKLQAGQPTRVIEKNGIEHGGRFSALTDSGVVLTTAQSDMAIERTNVRKIQIKGNHRVRNALIGVGIGLGVGVTIDRTLGSYFRNEAGQSGSARVLTFMAPIAIGGGIGLLTSGWRTVYQS